jgi:hypothetical protein
MTRSRSNQIVNGLLADTADNQPHFRFDNSPLGLRQQPLRGACGGRPALCSMRVPAAVPWALPW